MCSTYSKSSSGLAACLDAHQLSSPLNSGLHYPRSVCPEERGVLETEKPCFRGLLRSMILFPALETPTISPSSGRSPTPGFRQRGLLGPQTLQLWLPVPGKSSNPRPQPQSLHLRFSPLLERAGSPEPICAFCVSHTVSCLKHRRQQRRPWPVQRSAAQLRIS